MNQIEISIVMSVFNEQSSLKQTMHSILSQEGVSFELIVVNDGSTDDSREILEQYAEKDKRIVFINQTNQGITRALINGCQQANGGVIARQDAGDWSLPDRLKRQLDLLNSKPKAVLCSTGSRYFSERGELLYEAHLTPEEANSGLTPDTLDCMKGPSHHGCTMFKRDAYEQCGGYRSSFLVAQDLDLWTRLVSIGEHVVLPDVYYEAVLREGAISTKKRKLQEVARQSIYECIQLRKDIGDDTAHVNQLKKTLSNLAVKKTDAKLDYSYFVGSALLINKPIQSRFYFKQNVKSNPTHLKSWIKLIYSYFL